jgi:hypothetical protein
VTQPAEPADAPAAGNDWPDREACYERRYEQRWAAETLASESLTCWIEDNALKPKPTVRVAGISSTTSS